jgi:hypothetical protein
MIDRRLVEFLECLEKVITELYERLVKMGKFVARGDGMGIIMAVKSERVN